MTKIEWVRNIDGMQGQTWNPIGGCSPVSEGCLNCYAIKQAWRMGHNPNPAVSAMYKSTVAKTSRGLGWTGNINLSEDRLNLPLKRKKPTTYFVCSMSDLFHEDVPFGFISAMMDVMEEARQHTFLILTKRPENISKWAMWDNLEGPDLPTNLWLGVTVEHQRTAYQRIPSLLKIPTTAHFLSCEPLLGPIDLMPYLPQHCAVHNTVHRHGRDCLRPRDDQPVCVDWVIAGCESGPNRRRSEIAWFRDLQHQCECAGVPYFLKQMEIDGKVVKMPELDGRQWAEMPEVQ